MIIKHCDYQSWGKRWYGAMGRWVLSPNHIYYAHRDAAWKLPITPHEVLDVKRPEE